ncbi:hypothetical protein HYY69_03390 [Candidatus Woesearchaeota archaeon]|nr:hypothetical protein [Candidatus Woesearchaeota archaeon]
MVVVTSCSKSTQLPSQIKEITMYKTPMCGCCGLYNQYLNNKFDAPVKLVEMQDINPIKEKYGIPSEVESCHTTVIDNYFIEGHMPQEAITKLLTEKPEIKGIGMPGMPSGSPGMPGNKQGDFVVYAVQKDGSVTEFMRI